MLRISEISNSKNEVILKLDGKIIDLWVAELERICTNCIDQADRNLVLDFAAVSYISSEGITLLNRFKDKIKIINAQPYLELCLKNRGLQNQVKYKEKIKHES
ncbi:MAG: STAS domain-containing protein [Thermodesulfobacteriota bacterium]